MVSDEHEQDRLTDFERVICYHTLPSVTSPLTFGIIVAFGVLFLAEAIVGAYGVRVDNETWSHGGAIALGATAALAVVVFIGRAIWNQVNQRAALAEAAGVPDVEFGFDEVPDPFADHVLLRRLLHGTGDEVTLSDDRGNTRYVMERGAEGWTVRDAEGNAYLELSQTPGARSFIFSPNTPSAVQVSRDGAPVVEIRRRFNFGPAAVEMAPIGESDVMAHRAAGGDIFAGDTLVGRVYAIRKYVYLDIQEAHLDAGTLAFLLTMV